MTLNRKKVEREFFRRLNSVVEPAVRKGIGSPRFSPTTLIVLESIGFKSGMPRRTPLFATRLGSHVLISTFRGERSFWVRNLVGQPHIRYYLGGRSRSADAFVINAGKDGVTTDELPASIRLITRLLRPYTKLGWVFAVLAPPVADNGRTPVLLPEETIN